MPASIALSKGLATAIITAILASYALWEAHAPVKGSGAFAKNFLETSVPGEHLEIAGKPKIFSDAGFTLWPNAFCGTLVAPGDRNGYPLSSGFGYAIPSRAYLRGPGTLARLHHFDYENPLQRAARMRDGHDVIIRIIVLGNEGHEHLQILRRIATSKDSLLSTIHALPMLAEFHREDITFGIFPKVGGAVWQAYDYWAQNSVGDVLEMIMQMLEALVFIHDLRITHRDAFHDNFVIQWHPESLATMTICLLVHESMRLTGYPLGGSVTDPAKYARPHAPEFASGNPYTPFKLDVWQLGKSLENFKSTISAIDEVLADMINPDPVH
ncbi:hypothetical protein BYT27DRAFT_7249494 [Phlegmacium glaucopus]|nr:hypothetical protein BYT27DRAFT_7249494 [Phlegmacium glaucopus]